MNLSGIMVLVIAFVVGFLLLLRGRNARRIGFIILIMIIFSIIFFVWRSYRYGSLYSQIEIGSPQTQVRSLLGKPSKTTDCTISYGGYSRDVKETPPGCAEEYWYHSFFTPEAWSFRFDKEKKLIHKYHWVSP